MTSDKGRRELDDSVRLKQELAEKIGAALSAEDAQNTLRENDIDVRNVSGAKRFAAAVEFDSDPDDPVTTRPPIFLPFEPDGVDGFDPLFPPGV